MTPVPVRLPYALLRGILLASGELYCSLLLELAAGFPLDLHTSMLSELAAADQPTSLYARAMDLSTGILLVLAAVLSRAAVKMHRDLAALVISTALFGVGTMSTVFFPMSCAPSLSQACLDSENGGRVGLALFVHAALSTVAGTGCVAMSVCILLVLRRAGWGRTWGRVAAVTAGAALVSQIWLTVVLGIQQVTGDDTHPPGILQRASVLLVCLMLGTVMPGLKEALCR
jgi:hypothetical protein